MSNLTILNTKQIKQLLSQIQDQWGAEWKPEFAFLENTQNKVFMVNKEMSSIDSSKLRINSLGLYFCEKVKNGIRLSIEGSQLVGPQAKKNIVTINSQQLGKWLLGEDIDIEQEHASGFVLLKCETDFVGCGLYQNGLIKNFVGKNRRISAVH